MYFKLAFRNVKKSYKDFLIYFTTLTFSVALFYVFNSFSAQSVILELDSETSYMVETLVRVMQIMSLVVSVIFGFLILYANNFLIKRRKKELGMYTLLGMKKSKINRVLVYETIFIGLASLFSGLLLGVVLSQVSATFSARLIEVPVNFKFVFSFYSVIITSLSFMAIFIFVGIFNLINLQRYKLIDLLKAEKINESLKISNTWLNLIVLLLSLGLLIFTYYWVLSDPWFLDYILLVIVLGSVANFGLFYGLSALITKVPKLFPKFYNKNLNTFNLRQIGAKINSTYKMMAVVSIMLLLGIGALATSFNINRILANEYHSNNPYDLTIGTTYTKSTSIDRVKDIINLDKIRYQDLEQVNIYHSGISLDSLADQIISVRPTKEMDLHFEVAIISLDEYNSLRKSQNMGQQTLEASEILYFSSTPLERRGVVSGYSDYSYQLKDDIEFAGLNFKVKDSKNHHDHKVMLMNSIKFQRFFMVMNDKDLEAVRLATKDLDKINESVIFNLDFYPDQNREEIFSIIDDLIYNLSSNDYPELTTYSLESKENAALMVRESTLLYTYVGLYLGLVFIISSAVLLSLQLVSEASDNQSRYKMLSKLGVSDKMMRLSIFKQNLLYFSLPMFVALIHSWVGITAINNVLLREMFYRSDVKLILTTTGSVIIVYILYFLFTYKSSVNIIENQN